MEFGDVRKTALTSSRCRHCRNSSWWYAAARYSWASACARARSLATTATSRDVSPAWAKAGSTARAMSPRPTTAYPICFAMLSCPLGTHSEWVLSGQKCKHEATHFRYVTRERREADERPDSQDLGLVEEKAPHISHLSLPKHVTSVYACCWIGSSARERSRKSWDRCRRDARACSRAACARPRVAGAPSRSSTR